MKKKKKKGVFAYSVHSCFYSSVELQMRVNLLKPNDIYIYIYIYIYTHTHTYMSYRGANLQTLHLKYLFNKYTY